MMVQMVQLEHKANQARREKLAQPVRRDRWVSTVQMEHKVYKANQARKEKLDQPVRRDR